MTPHAMALAGDASAAAAAQHIGEGVHDADDGAPATGTAAGAAARHIEATEGVVGFGATRRSERLVELMLPQLQANETAACTADVAAGRAAAVAAAVSSFAQRVRRSTRDLLPPSGIEGETDLALGDARDGVDPAASAAGAAAAAFRFGHPDATAGGSDVAVGVHAANSSAQLALSELGAASAATVVVRRIVSATAVDASSHEVDDSDESAASALGGALAFGQSLSPAIDEVAVECAALHPANGPVATILDPNRAVGWPSVESTDDAKVNVGRMRMAASLLLGLRRCPLVPHGNPRDAE